MRKITTLAIMLFLSLNISGQIKTFTLEEAIVSALKNNREVKIAKMEVSKADAAVDEAFGYALPSIDLTANLAHFIEKPKTAFPDFGAMLTNATYSILFDEGVLPEDENKYLPLATKLQSFAQTNSFESKIQLTQILFNSAVFRGIGASQIYLSLSEEQLKSSVSKTILNVKKAFYGVLLSRQMLNIVEASLLNAEENLSNVKALHAQGLTSDYDALQVEVMVENIRPKVLELKNIVKSAEDGFKIILGLDQETDIDVVGMIEYNQESILSVQNAMNLATEQNLDLKSLQIKRNIDEEFIAIERSDYWPTIAAFGNFTYAGSSDNWNFQTYNSTLVGLSFTMNLFKGGRVANKVEQAVIAVKQTDSQINLTRDYVASQAKNKVLELEREKSQINALIRNEELASKAYEIASTRYKEGVGTQLEIKNADVELRTARTNKLQSIHNYIISVAELDELLGEIPAEYLEYIKK
ncbi:MAG: TolC family protein [Bacteroidetes bacterium]|nr:TolC family protein [Bacteroidota bacterium]